MSDEFVGLEDGGKEVISCLACGENLCVIWSVDPSAADPMYVKAKCPFCEGGFSKKYVINRKDRLGIPDNNKVSHVDFGDLEGNTQVLLPFAAEVAAEAVEEAAEKINTGWFGSTSGAEEEEEEDGEI